MEKVLVTGGAGFIASHIVDLLLNAGYEVVIVDNLSTGSRHNVNPDAKFYEMDIRSDGLDVVFRTERPTVVIHQAAQGSVIKSLENPREDVSINIAGTVNLLQKCIVHNVEKVIYASSAAVYGNPEGLPVGETHQTKPMSPYGLSKLMAEDYIKLFSRMHGLKYTILRYANVYGPRQDPHGEAGVISIFMEKFLRGQSPTIFGDGDQTRDFIYVTDVARANLAALSHGDNLTANVSTGKMTSVNRLARLMEEIMGVQVQRDYQPARAADILHSYLNYTAARDILLWNPRVELESGLEQTIEFFKSKRVEKIY